MSYSDEKNENFITTIDLVENQINEPPFIIDLGIRNVVGMNVAKAIHASHGWHFKFL